LDDDFDKAMREYENESKASKRVMTDEGETGDEENGDSEGSKRRRIEKEVDVDGDTQWD
jgi:hypothetical protein